MVTSQPIVNDRGRQAAALNNALSASYGAQDGDVIQLSGFTTAGDGGDLLLRYDASATDTVDGIFTFPGKGGALSFTGVTFDGTAGTGRYKTLNTTDVNMLHVGADDTGGTECSSAFQRALTALPAGGQILFPAGTYLVKDVTIPDEKKIEIHGTGARLLAAPTATFILNLGGDTTRDNPLHISGITLDGNDIEDVIGMDMPIRTNTLLEGITIRRCHYGLNLLGYNMKLESCVFQGNVVGTRIYQDAISGGGNGNTYDNVEWYGNTVGFLMDGTATSDLPCQNSVFQGCVVQNNSLCGAAFFQTSNSVFIATHFEANFTAGTTLDVDGVTVRGANIHLNASTLKTIHMSPAYTSPNVVLENDSSIEVAGAEFFGSTTGPWIKDIDGDSSAYLHGRISAGTQAQCLLRSLPDFIQTYVSFSFSALPLVKNVDGIENLMLTPQAPLLENAAGCTVNANVFDDEFGENSSVTFSASAGSTSTNRVTISSGVGTISTGDQVIISFLCKTDANTTLVFELTDGNFARYDYLSTDRKWRRIVMMVNATTTNTPSLYVYPSDAGGATVLFSKMMTHKVASGDNTDDIQRIMKEGLFNGDSSPVVDLAITSDEQAITLSLGYEKYFEMHLIQDGDGGNSVVWPNDAVFYGFPPQPTLGPNSVSVIPFHIRDGEFLCSQVVASSTNYRIVQDGVDDLGTIPSITFPDAGTVMVKLKLGSATHATRTQGLQLAASGAGDSHYPYSDGDGYIDWLRTTRESPITLEVSVNRTLDHWVIVRTDSTDNWEFLQATTGGTLHSLATATHETLGTITTGKLHNNTQWEVERMIFFGSRLSDANLQAVIASAFTDGLPVAPLARYEINYDPGTTKLHDSSGNDLHIPMTGIDQTIYVEV